MSLPVLGDFFTFGHVAALVASATFVAFLYKRYQAAPNITNGLPLPPGPPARWFWQKAMPSVNTARTLARWATEYGPVITLRQGSQVTIIIGRVDAATEIMEKEGAALVDRPRAVAGGEMVSGSMRLLFIRSGERFRRFRKIVQTHLQPGAVKLYQGLQLGRAMDVITDILNDPKNHRAHAQRYAVSVILRVAYGQSSPTSAYDPEVVRVQESVRNLQHALRPGVFLVDRIPLLKYIPWYGKVLREYHKFEKQLFKEQMIRVQSEMDANTCGNSFMKTLLENVHEHQLSTDEIAYLGGNLYGAGSETSAVGITNMILAAARHPDAQRRVQEELDTVVGKDRLPAWRDSESLPQLHAYVSEVLRWRPITSTGFPHRATQDIVWRGYCIPAGAVVLGCHLAICQDPSVFPDPDKFDPQRWIDDHGRFQRDMMRFFPFGFGRRVCPGQHLASNSLYITTALLLWSFRIVEKLDKPIDVDAYSDDFVSQPGPFEVEFIPRMEEGRLREMVTRDPGA